MKMRGNLKSLSSLPYIVSASFFTLLIVNFYISHAFHQPLDNFNNRVISEATIYGVDINSRSNLYLKSIALAVIFLFLYSITAIYIKNFIEKSSNKFKLHFNFECKLFNYSSLFGILTIIYGLFGAEIKINLLFIFLLQSYSAILSIIRLIAANYNFNWILNLLSNSYFKIWQIIFSFSWSFTLLYYTKDLNLISNLNLIHFFLVGNIFNIIIFYLILIILKKPKLTKDTLNRIFYITFPLFITPIFYPLSNELYLILNQKGVLFLSPSKLLILLISCSIAMSILLSLKNKIVFGKDFGSIIYQRYYPALLIFMISILYQPPLEYGPPSELFESGNPGIAIDQFFRYNKIPLVETFNAHAFSELLSPFIFSLINGYQEWASFLYEPVIMKLIFIIIIYFFLKIFLNPSFTIFLILFTPWEILTMRILPEYYILGVIPIFTFIFLIKEQNLKNFIIFWFVLSLTFIWRFDIGAATIPSGIFAYFIFAYVYKIKINLKYFILTGFSIALFWTILFISSLVWKGIPVIFRIKEIKNIVLSNQVWGYSSLGDINNLNYPIFYIILPFVLLTALFVVIWTVRFKIKIDPLIFTSIIFIIMFSIFNFSRGMVRHTLIENTTVFLLGFTVIIISILSIIKSKFLGTYKQNFTFLCVLLLLNIFIFYTNSSEKSQDSSLITLTNNKFNSFENHPTFNSQIQRYVETHLYKMDTYASIKKLFDLTLKENETFLDFSNTPYLYILTKRVTPMYINQTPAFLSDDISQSAFLKEIQAYSLPYAVFANNQGWHGLDGISSNIRAYKISEYIFQNYIPYITINGFDLWIKPDFKLTADNIINDFIKKEKPLSVIKNLGLTNISSYDILEQKKSQNGIYLKSGLIDPQIFNLLENPQNDILENYFLQLEYSSTKADQLKVYYAIDNKDFNEEDSVIAELKANANKEIINIPMIPGKLLTDVRLDPPREDNFYIHSLKIVKLNEEALHYSSINFPGNETSHILWLPYYWGEMDKNNAKASTISINLLEKSTRITSTTPKTFEISKDISKENGNYIHFNIRSIDTTEPFTITFTYKGITDSGEMLNGAYTFLVKPDEKSYDYLIRVSSQYNWNASKIKEITIQAEQTIEMNKINILEGD